ncbi:MAG: hypothetical protein OXD46_09205 [Chloroflexi bacterium]|nr:hypothetical protein [Chloroflexota bacterium]
MADDSWDAMLALVDGIGDPWYATAEGRQSWRYEVEEIESLRDAGVV